MWYDLLILAILGYATFRGATKGFVWQLASIAGLLLCFAFAESLSPLVSPYLGLQPPLNRWVAMLGIYMFFSFVAFGVARYLKAGIEKYRFVEYDRHLGGIFGFIKGGTIALIFTFFVVTLSEQARGYILNSHSGYAAAVVMDRLHPILPVELHDVLEPYIHQLDRPDMDLDHSPHAGHDGHHHDHGTKDVGNDYRHGNDELSQDDPPTPWFRRKIESWDDLLNLDDEELEAFLSRMAGIFDTELQAKILKAIRNTDPEDRPLLIEQLGTEIPGLIRTVAAEWSDGKPEDDGKTNQQQLLREIAAIYTEYPDAQLSVIEEIEWLLAGLPDEIQLAVLEDWHADLLGLSPDPDPKTNLTTPLDVRILNQLAYARIPLNSLGSTMQNRLRDSLPR